MIGLLIFPEATVSLCVGLKSPAHTMWSTGKIKCVKIKHQHKNKNRSTNELFYSMHSAQIRVTKWIFPKDGFCAYRYFLSFLCENIEILTIDCWTLLMQPYEPRMWYWILDRYRDSKYNPGMSSTLIQMRGTQLQLPNTGSTEATKETQTVRVDQ